MSGAALRAQQIWQILIARASNRQTITYSGIAELLWSHGYGANTLASPLNGVSDYCRKNNLPDLTILVVNVGGEFLGQIPEKSHGAVRETVFSHRWFAETPPNVGDFGK